MKKAANIIILMIIMMLLSSCGGPDALLINFVRKDGSVKRKLILTYHKDEFDLSDCQVPVDSSWTLAKSYDVSEDGDTTYSLTAVREFESVSAVNRLYKEYDGSNPGMIRTASFDKKFRWFNTFYRYSENIKAALEGIPPEDYFSEEELDYFYMPEKLIDSLLEGPDSTSLKVNMIDPLDEKTEEWFGRSLVKAFISKLRDTARVNNAIVIDTGLIFKKEQQVLGSLDILLGDMGEEELVDSLLGKGFYVNNRALVDTLMSDVEEEFLVAFETDSYLVQAYMPGELTSTNGYIDEDGNVLWQVTGPVFLSSDYNMWAESGTTNLWAWILTGAFVLFVITGLLIKAKRQTP